MEGVVDEVFVSVRDDQVDDDTRSRFRLISDRLAGLGPAAGIAAMLRLARLRRPSQPP